MHHRATIFRPEQGTKRLIPRHEAAKGVTLNQWHVVFLSLGIGVALWLTTAIYYWTHLNPESRVFQSRSGSIVLPSKTAESRLPRGALKEPLATPHVGKSLGLQRSLHAINLERAMDVDHNVGACTMGQAVLEDMDILDCGRLHCMWSEHLHSNVDMWFNALEALDPEIFREPCQKPRGGQLPPTTPAPRIAFIITVHNKPKVAAQCLLEAFRVAGEVSSAEFIIVDDGSTDDMRLLLETADRLRAYFSAHVQVLHSRQATGFGAACTRGVRASHAEYIMLLNSDAFLMKGSVFALLATFKAVPTAGIVGPMFIGADHRISEAGGIVFASGDPINYGRGRHVGHEFNFRRPTDYISAACVVISRELFLKVGGFDSMYGMGFFEDTDLAATVRKGGYQVVFQPLAVVFHQEGSTLGVDGSPMKRELMAANQVKFAAKWATELRKQCPTKGGHDLAARRALSPKLLWIDDIVPETDHDSGSIRTRHMLRILVENGYDVSFQPTASGRQPRYTQQARFAGIDVLPVLPPSAWDLGMDSICRYDVILVARRYVFEPIRDMVLEACPDTPVIYDTVDLHFLREARDALTAAARPAAASWNFSNLAVDAVLGWLDSHDPAAAEVRRKRDTELALVDHSRLTIVVSDIERQALHHYRPQAKIHIISNIHQVQYRPSSCAGRHGMLFVGNLNHGPNRQAIEQLLTGIMPRARQLLPPEEHEDFVVHVVGSNQLGATDELRRLLHETQGVQFHGYLPDELLKMLYRSVKVVVAPLLSGAGVKGKVNQAMKYGVPVVATPIAVEAMHVEEGTTCMVARSREEFVRMLVQVYTDCKLWDALVVGGFANVQQHFSVESAYAKVLQAFVEVGAGALEVEQREGCEVQIFGG